MLCLTHFFPTKNVPLGDEKSKMHATFYFPRFWYSHYERRAQRKLRMSLNSEGKRQKHIIVCTLKLWRHSIWNNSLPSVFSICTFFPEWSPIQQCSNFYLHPDLSLIFRLVYPDAYSTSLLGWLIGFSNLPCPKQIISFRITGRKKSSEIRKQNTEQ